MRKSFFNKKLVCSIPLALTLSITAWADQNGWQYQAGTEDSQQVTDLNNNQEYAFRFPVFEDDITPDQDVSKVQLTPAQQHQAKVWGLSEQEEARYVLLMQNRSKVYFDRDGVLATPVDILALNARTDDERNHYTQLSAFQDYIKNAKILAYQKAYNDASQTLNAKYKLQPIRPFDVSKFSPYKNVAVQLQAGDRLMFYVRPGENTVQITSGLLSLLKKQADAQLNVYFLGDNITQSQAVEWAKTNNIPQSMVSSGEITLNLNFNNDQGISKTPTMYLVRDGSSRVVDLSLF